MSKHYDESELIINPDGTIFHLHLLPEHISSTIIMMGDPDRVTCVGEMLDTIEYDIKSREFHTITGSYKGKRITVLSHGIGPDNIDIVMTELDALVNIDFHTRTLKETHTTLTIIRVGTSGSLQPDIPIGTFSVAEISIGLDTVIHYYADSERVIDHDLISAFMTHTNWNINCGKPYAVHADPELTQRFLSLKYDPTAAASSADGSDSRGSVAHEFHFHRGITLAAAGFYGPQGREIRLPLQNPSLNSLITSFRHGDHHIANYEMESAALAGLGKLLDHKVLTICCIINNRLNKSMNGSYKSSIHDLLALVLEHI